MLRADPDTISHRVLDDIIRIKRGARAKDRAPPAVPRSSVSRTCPTPNLIWRCLCQGACLGVWLSARGVGSAEGAAGLAVARRAVRLIFAGWHRRTGFRRESPLSNTERGRRARARRLLIVRSWMLSRVGARRVPPPPQPSVVGDQKHRDVSRAGSSQGRRRRLPSRTRRGGGRQRQRRSSCACHA
jgi:hypothetical protein